MTTTHRTLILLLAVALTAFLILGRGDWDMDRSGFEDMLHDSNIGRPSADGIKTAYETLRETNEVVCVLLTAEEFEALTGKVPA